ncbi:hypothetical protein P3X46_016197 [Hevea brasiliensis]|uniref:Uncharacterized protein n=1 Tax=Hevea brasiliensis TaxID=3981 RepID=A0ABQ9M2C5_HEVBR|nr:uncharacterized protein LOC110657979 [Hevea brasiliensis]KAJ9173019.1 hypothetical protein P3X46_016197 [Hevea brasiliensis]
MESNSLFSSSVLPSLSFPSKNWQTHQKTKFHNTKRCNRGVALAAGRRSDSFGEMHVDESMIVLRKRIHEMKMMERNYEPPAEWMEWEKQLYASYDEFICKFVGFLQLKLMNTRPSLAMGMLLLITMSVPVSTATIALQLMEVANGAISTLHL